MKQKGNSLDLIISCSKFPEILEKKLLETSVTDSNNINYSAEVLFVRLGEALSVHFSIIVFFAPPDYYDSSKLTLNYRFLLN